ncbi:MAG: helix-turn-helix domain-containing protein [Acutalibacteraceae bacterium]
MLNYSRSNHWDGNYMDLMAYYKRTFEKGFHTAFNKHSTYEIMYVVSGKCVIYLLDEWRKDRREKVILSKNEFIFIDMDLPHKLVIDEECRIYNVEVRPSHKTQCPIDILSFMRANNQMRDFYMDKFGYVVSQDRDNVLDIIKKIHNVETEKNDIQSLLDRQTIDIQLQLAIADLFIAVLKCAVSNKQKLSYGAYYANQAVVYINNNYKYGAIPVSEIAKVLKVNKTYLQKLFKQNTGKTITEYILELRIRDAANLLKVSDMSIVDIAFEVGFNSRQNFYLAFKKQLGISPSEYKDSIVNEEIEVFDDNRINFNETLND